MDDWDFEKQDAWLMYWHWILEEEEAQRRGDKAAAAEAKAEADWWHSQWAWL